MYSSDGNVGQHRIIDLTNVREKYMETGRVVVLSKEDVVGETKWKRHYAHSAALSEDGDTLYVFDENNIFDIGIYDVSDPRNPTLVRFLQWSREADLNSDVHNGVIWGDFLIVSYYSVGIRIFDVSDREDPVEVGNYETWRDPEATGTFIKSAQNYYGAWNVHVMPSGNILCSDVVSGTFTFQLAS